MIPGPNPGKAGPVLPKPTLARVPPVLSGPDQAWFLHGLAVEDRFGGERRLVARPGRGARRIARLALLEGAAPAPLLAVSAANLQPCPSPLSQSGPVAGGYVAQHATAIWQFYDHSFPIKQSLAARQEQRRRTASSLPHATLGCPRISLNGALRTASCVSSEIPASMVCCRNQKISGNFLPLCDQGLRFP